MSSTAILIVDPQIDFFPGGAMGIKDGDAVVRPINNLLRAHRGAPVLLSRDWHPDNSAHFKIWPKHCVQGTKGAEFRSDIEVPDDYKVVTKGDDPEDDGGYSAFEGKVGTKQGDIPLGDYLRSIGVDTLFVAGLATEFCIHATVLDAIKQNFAVTVLEKGIRPVNRNPGDGERAIAEMQSAGAFFAADIL